MSIIWMVSTRNEWYRNMGRNMWHYSRSLRFISGQKPLLSTFRGGFSYFRLGKNAPKMHRTSFRRRNGLAGKAARRKSLHRALHRLRRTDSPRRIRTCTHSRCRWIWDCEITLWRKGLDDASVLFSFSTMQIMRMMETYSGVLCVYSSGNSWTNYLCRKTMTL